jgi:hypothetical protein
MVNFGDLGEMVNFGDLGEMGFGLVLKYVVRPW